MRPRWRSLLLPQVDVDEAAEQQQRHTHPGQDEAVAEVSGALRPRLPQQDLLVVQRVDQSCRKGSQPWNKKKKNKEEPLDS